MAYQKMDPEFKKEWVAALRSGEYIQGNGWLCVRDRYCCLGVAAKLKNAFDPDPEFVSPVRSIKYKDEFEEVYLTETLRMEIDLEESAMYRLAEMNDYGKSFDKIADWIEENL